MPEENKSTPTPYRYIILYSSLIRCPIHMTLCPMQVKKLSKLLFLLSLKVELTVIFNLGKAMKRSQWIIFIYVLKSLFGTGMSHVGTPFPLLRLPTVFVGVMLYFNKPTDNWLGKSVGSPACHILKSAIFYSYLWRSNMIIISMATSSIVTLIFLSSPSSKSLGII